MEDQKMSRGMFVFLTVLVCGLYIGYAVWLFWCHPFVSCAAEKDDAVPGGVGNTVSVTNHIYGSGYDVKNVYTMISTADTEIVAYYDGFFIRFKHGKFSTGDYLGTLNENWLDDVFGYHIQYNGDKLYNQYNYNKENLPSYVEYKPVGDDKDRTVTYTISGCKIFVDSAAVDAYFKSGSLDGMVNVNVDMGVLDKDIGYLHDLTRKPLQYGETDENGIPESFDDCFTWSDFYPEYDDTYLVEVRASCAVETKKWFGLSKGTVYNSDIRNLANGISYKDLEFIISMADERSVFADFINEHMPDESSLKSFGAVGAYQFDVFYFRIYRWDEELNSYRYGEWVRLARDGTPLLGTLKSITDVGHFDKNGNWITNIDTEYGEGKSGTDIVGSGNTRDEAKEDADSKKDKIESGDNKIDLSNTNFAELWEWFCKCLISFWNGIGVIPEFFGRVFSFLPATVIGFIGLGIVAAIILRILGR